MSRTVLVLGGARSGKSAYAEGLAERYREKIYIATAEAFDEEMRERIAYHQGRRGSGWRTVEAPLDLGAAIRAEDGPRRFILVDCITVWINNLLYRKRAVAPELAKLGDSLQKTEAHIVLVSNEIGSGIVPDNALARLFRDEAGRANQAISAAVDEVVLITAGLPLTLKKTRQAAVRRKKAASVRGRKA